MPLSQLIDTIISKQYVTIGTGRKLGNGFSTIINIIACTYLYLCVDYSLTGSMIAFGAILMGFGGSLSGFQVMNHWADIGGSIDISGIIIFILSIVISFIRLFFFFFFLLQSNPADLTGNYAGIVFSLTNSFGSFPAFILPLIFGYLASNYVSRKNNWWKELELRQHLLFFYSKKSLHGRSSLLWILESMLQEQSCILFLHQGKGNLGMKWYIKLIKHSSYK